MKKRNLLIIAFCLLFLIIGFLVFSCTKLYWTLDKSSIAYGGSNGVVYGYVPLLTKFSDKEMFFKSDILNVSEKFYDQYGFINNDETIDIEVVKTGFHKIEYTLNDAESGAQWLVKVDYGFFGKGVEVEEVRDNQYKTAELEIFNSFLQNGDIEAKVSMSDTLLKETQKSNRSFKKTETITDKGFARQICSTIETADKTVISAPDTNEDFTFEVVLNDKNGNAIVIKIWKESIIINKTCYSISNTAYTGLYNAIMNVLCDE